jgi:hypothetical protein
MRNFTVNCQGFSTIEAVRTIRDTYKKISGTSLGLKVLRDAVVEGTEIEVENRYAYEFMNSLKRNGIQVNEVHAAPFSSQDSRNETILDRLFILFDSTGDPQYILAACEFKKTFVDVA